MQTGNAASPAIQYKGTDKGRFLVYKKSSWNDKYYTASHYIESTSIASCILSYSAFFDPVATSTNPGTVAEVIEASDTQTVWSTESESKSMTVFGVTRNVTGTKIFDQIDEEKKLNNLISGSTVNSETAEDKILSLYEDNVNKIDKENRVLETDYCVGYMANYRISDKSQPMQSVTTDVTKNGIKSYRHKYDKVSDAIPYSNYVIDDISQTVDDAVYYYSGLPIFKANDKGMVTFKMTLTNSEGANSSFQIRPSKFNNSAISPGISDVPNNKCTFNKFDNAESGKEYTLSFQTAKNTTYWIKILPHSGTTVATASNIVITKE